MTEPDDVTRMPETKCCECGHTLSAVTQVTGERSGPKPGDWTLCIACTCLNMVGEDGALRRPNDAELIEAAASKEIQEIRRRMIEFKKRHPMPSASDAR